jgi:hypothetical protein
MHFIDRTYTLLPKKFVMKPLNKIISLFIVLLITINLSAQPRHGMVKPPPRINSAARAAVNASINARLHANSNSVFGIGNTHPNYSKKEEPKQEEIKDEKDEGDVKKGKGKKHKK